MPWHEKITVYQSLSSRGDGVSVDIFGRLVIANLFFLVTAPWWRG
jgi:hypothetical protein